MNSAHLHLILNHVPVVGSFFGLALLGLGVWLKSEQVKKLSLAFFLVVAIFSVPVYLTGEPAEDLVEGMPDVSKPILEEHEEAAVAAFSGMIVVGVIALAGLGYFRKGKTVPSWFTSVMLAASLTAAGLMVWTANLGGQVHHSEIRAGAVAEHDENDH